MEIGIITFHNANNYGAVLQCYALAEVLKNKGNSVELINVPSHGKSVNMRSLIRTKVASTAFLPFRKNFLPNSVDFKHRKQLYIFGSDQVWNPQITKSNYPFYFGSWIEADTPKIAYAASFGISSWAYPEYTKDVKKYLENFSSIGIRETSGKQIAKEVFGIDSQKVLDPTLLLTKYDNLFKVRKSSKTLVCYIFGKSEMKVNEIREIAQKTSLSAVLLNDLRFRKNIKSVPFPTVSKWLSHLHSSELILTDSFHCMVFAIIFNKNFVAIPAIPERVDRMLSLLNDLGLRDRFFNDISEICDSKILLADINFTEVNAKIVVLRNESINFLENSLNALNND